MFPLAEAVRHRRLADLNSSGNVLWCSSRSMGSLPIGVSFFTLIAVVSILLAAATIWAFVTNPVTAATA
jgi:hypothetical protein